MADNATLALNSGLCFFRVFFFISFAFLVGSKLHLSPWSEFRGPLHTTGPEIWQQMDTRMDAMVCGVGSGGTITGLGRFFSRHAPNVEMVLADPAGSVLAEHVRSGKMLAAGSWLVEGIGEDFLPPICDLSPVRHAYTVSDEESLLTARALLRQEGILAGSSSGT